MYLKNKKGEFFEQNSPSLCFKYKKAIFKDLVSIDEEREFSNNAIPAIDVNQGTMALRAYNVENGIP